MNNSTLSKSDPTIQQSPTEFTLRQNQAKYGEITQKRRTIVQDHITQRPLCREIQKGEIDIVSEWNDYEKRELELAIDTQLTLAHEAYEGCVARIKVEHREQFIAFVTEAEERLRKTVYERRDGFLKALDQQYGLAEHYQESRPELANQLRESLATELDAYFKWLLEMLAWFKGITQERVSQYRLELS